jgi:protocatechuate 3,4-dioxygenase beta subunit
VIVSCGPAQESEDASGETSGGDGDGDGDGDDDLCEATPPDIEGPFYRDGIPIRDTLDLYGDAGTALALSGTVVDGSCSPVANAVIEFWHASPAAPGSEAGEPDATYDDSEELRYYGQTATDDAGAYSLATLIPGWYLNGAKYRPAHVHVKVWVDGEERLTTQLYFDGDPFNADDPWFNEDTMLVLDDDGNATFDFAV